MKRRAETLVVCLLVVSISLGSPSITFAQTAGGAPAVPLSGVASTSSSPEEPWPRTTNNQGATISIFQPQLESWTGNQIAARAAVRVKSASSTDYGVIWVHGAHGSRQGQSRGHAA